MFSHLDRVTKYGIATKKREISQPEVKTESRYNHI